MTQVVSTSGVCRLDIMLTSSLDQYRFYLFFYDFSVKHDKITCITSVLGNFQAEIAMREAGKSGMSDEEVC